MKRYLGDSVYAEFDGYHVVLTTDNGYGSSNTIALEPAVIAALNAYVAALDEALHKRAESAGRGGSDA